MTKKPYGIVLLPGDGIGPEVLKAAMSVMQAATHDSKVELSFEEHLFGGAGTDSVDTPLPDDTLSACLVADGILMGAVGGPSWHAHPREKRPETGLLRLRKTLGTFANLRPVFVPDSLTASSPLRSDIVAGTDLLIVRELTGGIYFGEPRGRDDHGAYNTLRYSEQEVERIARVGFDWAGRRRGSVVSVDKSNVLETSVLWRETVNRIHREEYPEMSLSHMYVDNAAMQIVNDPLQFDIILTGNMFGDILSDLAGTLPGSLGMLPSACVGGVTGLFEPVHGSASDIAGKDRANPIAAILSGAMLLEELGESESADRLRTGVFRALTDGFRTDDIRQVRMRTVGTQEMAEAITNRL